MAAVTSLGLGKTMEKNILYHLEAAIRGVEIKQLDGACKSELKTYFSKISPCLK